MISLTNLHKNRLLEQALTGGLFSAMQSGVVLNTSTGQP